MSWFCQLPVSVTLLAQRRWVCLCWFFMATLEKLTHSIVLRYHGRFLEGGEFMFWYRTACPNWTCGSPGVCQNMSVSYGWWVSYWLRVPSLSIGSTLGFVYPRLNLADPSALIQRALTKRAPESYLCSTSSKFAGSKQFTTRKRHEFRY